MDCTEHPFSQPSGPSSVHLRLVEEIRARLTLLEESLAHLQRPAERPEVTVPAQGSRTPDHCFAQVGPAQGRLTAREEQVLELLLLGRTNRRIATALGISENTVKNHCHAIFLKFSVGDRSELLVKILGST
ncbi:hypothetical protein GCM10020229_72490 [Kitasatospora albolonga]|uniref:helix-turn-helix transcriptional regulator n=1 Tax=Kitasatospora albolonga TaxID=68173 RepID=UPI0031EFFF25